MIISSGTSNGLLAASSKTSYQRSLLQAKDPKKLQADQLIVGEPYLFFYPFVTTPCLLINLGQSVDNSSSNSSWRGGVGPDSSIVAYSAICSHKMTHQPKKFHSLTIVMTQLVSIAMMQTKRSNKPGWYLVAPNAVFMTRHKEQKCSVGLLHNHWQRLSLSTTSPAGNSTQPVATVQTCTNAFLTSSVLEHLWNTKSVIQKQKPSLKCWCRSYLITAGKLSSVSVSWDFCLIHALANSSKTRLETA